MKIKALRVAELGTFSEGAAVEGMTGGLDVLIGPNEAGKSTLFRAIETVFLKSHRMTGQSVAAMLPRRGGRSPLIEADFVARDGLWRITKRFGRAPSATLHDLARDREVARGPDAEDALADLIGTSDAASGGGQFGLLWVGQQKSLLVPTPDYDQGKRRTTGDAERTTLRNAIAREVDSVAGGDVTRRVAARVAAELAEYLSPKRETPLTGSRYADALRRRDAIKRQLDVLRAEKVRAEERLALLAQLVAEREAVASHVVLAKRATDLRDASDVAERAASAARAFVLLAEKEQRARLEYQQSNERLQKFADALLESQQIVSQQGALTEQLPNLAEVRQATAERLEECDNERSRLERETDRLDELERRGRLLAQLDQRAAVSARVAEMLARIDQLRTGIAANRATPERLRRREEAERQLALAQSRAALPAAIDVAFELLPEASGKVRLDDRVVSAGDRIPIGDVTTISIEGVGVLRLMPADAEERAARRSDVERARTSVQSVEAEIGAEGVDVAGLAQDRERLVSECRILEDKVTALAPDGHAAVAEEVERLRREVSEIDARVGGDENAGTEIVAERRALLGERLKEVRLSRDKLFAEVTSHDQAISAGQSRMKELSGRLEKIGLLLGPQSERGAERDRLAGLRDKAADELKRLTLEHAALAETAPSEERLRELLAAKSAAQAALEMAESARSRLDKEIAKLEGEIKVAGEAEIEPELARVTEDLSAGEYEISGYENEIAALKLLRHTLAEVEARNRMRFLEPVMRRLAPYLVEVFPEAQPVFAEGFQLEALEREGEALPIDLLSDGTREQLAILVRLGFGHLLAETGTTVPVILDDALVYSDDDRIVRMFRVLEAASAQHQVLVFTCRAATFEPLGGQRLAVTPWAPPR